MEAIILYCIISYLMMIGITIAVHNTKLGWDIHPIIYWTFAPIVLPIIIGGCIVKICNS